MKRNNFGGSSLSYTEANFNNVSNIPPPSLNGGLYTGEAFLKDAPWGNVPITPSTDVYIHQNLRSANPPKQAILQYPHNIRLGNNHQDMRGIKRYNPNTHAIQCPNVPKKVPCVCYDECSCKKCYFRD